MRAFFDGWRDMNLKYSGEASFSVMFETFPQQRVREIPDETTAYPWRKGSDHFLYSFPNFLVERLFKAYIETA